MAINFPTSLDTFSNPASTDLLENATAALDHDVQHSNANDAIEALEAKVGIDGSAVTTSHDYKLSEVTSTDKAVGKTATQTLTNKTLTSPQLNFTSDAVGDMYYRNGSGTTARLAIGTSGQILSSSAGGIPEWIANPSVSDASETVKGVVEIATTAQITAGTTTGETGARLVVPADAVGTGANKIVQLNASAQLPAVSGALLTNMVNPSVLTSGSVTYDTSTASGTQTIAHGLGKIPKYIKMSALRSRGSSNDSSSSFGSYNGTNQYCVWSVGQGASLATASGKSATQILSVRDQSISANYTEAVASFDATNITLTWTKNGSITGNAEILWEAFA